LEKANDLRTNRAKRWRRVLFQRSIWAVCPVFLTDRLMVVPKHALVGPEVAVSVKRPGRLRRYRPELAATVRVRSPANQGTTSVGYGGRVRPTPSRRWPCTGRTTQLVQLQNVFWLGGTKVVSRGRK